MATVAKLDPGTKVGWADKAVADRFVEKARSLRAFLQSEAPAGEKRRSPTPAVDQMLKEEGFLRLLLPQRLGGFGLSPTDLSRVQIEVAKGQAMRKCVQPPIVGGALRSLWRCPSA